MKDLQFGGNMYIVLVYDISQSDLQGQGKAVSFAKKYYPTVSASRQTC